MNAGLPLTLLASVLFHLVGGMALSMCSGVLGAPAPPDRLIATALFVDFPPPAATAPLPEAEPASLSSAPVTPEESPPAPEVAPLPVPPPPVEPTTPPKLVAKPMPRRTTPPVQPVAPPAAQTRQKVPAPPRAAGPDRSGPALPLPPETRVTAGGNSLGEPGERPMDAPPPQPVEGGAAGAGKLLERGGVGVVPGTGAEAGSGAAGRAGLGAGGATDGSGTRVAGLQPGTGGFGPGGGSALARPLGGYQVKPRYPESARRQGAEGITLLKVQVSDRGLVSDVLVERSAGHHDLDLAAMEAVQQWRFEPAKRGNQPVTVWVMLPVRFTLR